MTNAVEFHRVTKTHGGTRPVLTNFDYEIASSEKILVLGANGVGKTTLFKLIAGISLPDSGYLLWNERPWDQSARKNLGVMFSLDLLYGGLTGRQNLTYTAHLYAVSDPRAAVEAACTQWALHDFIDQTVSTYSNGMKARLAIARATLHQPSLVLLDEPTAFLDTRGVICLTNYLRQSNATVLVATQQASVIEDCFDRELLL